jgi:TonB family protein
MRREDGISFFLSIIINIIILLLIPSLSAKHVANKKIKIGLVAYDNRDKKVFDGKKNSNSQQKKITSEIDKNKKTAEPKKDEKPKKDPNKVDLAALDSIAKKIVAPKVDVLSVAKAERENKTLVTPKKQYEQIKRSTPEKIENLDLNSDKIKFNSEAGKDQEFDRILHFSDGTEGLPSGYRLGTEDGDIVARWDNSNKEPVYPESAQARGLHGTVKIRMNIDENGNVRNLKLEKGSGVPEINNAIEEVGRTWKIYLSKNGLNVQGDVILEYNFVLK